MERYRRAIFAALASAVPASALAHPGHGTTLADSPLHILVDHPVLAIAVLGSIGLAASAVVRFLDRR